MQLEAFCNRTLVPSHNKVHFCVSMANMKHSVIFEVYIAKAFGNFWVGLK